MNDIMLVLNNIEYGYKDKDNHLHFFIDDNFSSNYVLQSPLEVLQNKVGVCWDQVELERSLFLEKRFRLIPILLFIMMVVNVLLTLF